MCSAKIRPYLRIRPNEFDQKISTKPQSTSDTKHEDRHSRTKVVFKYYLYDFPRLFYMIIKRPGGC